MSEISSVSEPEALDSLVSSFVLDFNFVFPVKLAKPINGNNSNRPNSKRKVCNRDRTWYSPDLRELKDLVVLIHDRFKAATSQVVRSRLYACYLKFNKLYRKRVSEAKKAYNVRFIQSSSNACKAAWEVINEDRPKTSKVHPTASPDEFNNFFMDAVNDIVSNLPISNMNPLAGLVHHDVGPTMNCWKEVRVSQIIKIVHSFKNSRTPDIHGISCYVLKYVIEVIATPLTRAINNCLKHGLFPDSLKIARSVPVYKKGNVEVLSNFRPISILPVFSKVVETVMKQQLTDFFEINSLFNNAQHGFRTGRSTTSALLSLVEKIIEAFEAGDSMALTLCDLSKAFDCVPHEILIRKLESYGVGGVVLSTLVSYLENRRQVVSLGGATSEERSVKHGVPQGSVMGPLLFLVLINDLYLNGSTLLFADDTTLMTRGKDHNQVLFEADSLLSTAKEWFTANKLKLNEDKTQVLLCTLRRSTEAEVEESVRLLGFWLDSKLSWEDHITQICSRLSRVIYLMRNLRYKVTEKYLLTAYHALFHSHVRYGLLLWGHAPGCERVLMLQKKVVRAIAHAGRIDHCRPIFVRLKILTVYGQYVLDSLLSIKNNLNTFTKRDEHHSYNIRGAQHLNVPRCRLTKTQKCFPMIALKLFNALPEEIRSLELREFKSVLRGRLLERPLYSLGELEEEPLF